MALFRYTMADGTKGTVRARRGDEARRLAAARMLWKTACWPRRTLEQRADRLKRCVVAAVELLDGQEED